MRGVLALTLVVLCASPAPLFAEVESDLVKKGVAAYEALEFEPAIATLNRALGESLTREEKIVTFRTLAFAYAALDRPGEARTAFTHLLRLDGNTDLDRTVAPRVRALFEEARALVSTGRGEPAGGPPLPRLDPVVSPAHPAEGQALSITIVHPGGMARSLHLFHRVAGESSYAELTAPVRNGKFELLVPGLTVRAPAVEYYAVALGEDNVALARAGTLARPLRIDVAAPKMSPRRRRAWIWGVAGGAVAVAGAGVVLAVLLTRTDPTAPTDVMVIVPR